MDLLARLTLFSVLDGIAVGLLFAAWLGIGLMIERESQARPSTSALMRRYRRDWMREFVTRQPRIFDANILSTLRQGTTFFASACMIAIGGGLVMASIPNAPDDPQAAPRAAQAAELNITASRSFNRGLRSVYFALAALAWLLGAVPLILATLAAFLVLYRREFRSRSRTILLGDMP